MSPAVKEFVPVMFFTTVRPSMSAGVFRLFKMIAS